MAKRTTAQANGTPTWLGLHAPDPVMATGFYRGLFGWETIGADDSDSDHLVLAKDGQPVAGLLPATGPKIGPPSWITYLATANIDETLASVRAAGGEILRPVQEGTQGPYRARP